MHDSILYQRGLYDASTFIRQSRYGLGLQVTADPTLSVYLQSVLAQLRQWLERGEVKRLVLVIAQADTEEVVERWVFNVQTDRDTIDGKHTSNRNTSHTTHLTHPSIHTDCCHSLTLYVCPRDCCCVWYSVLARSEKEIHNEVAAILRQITASTSFLPLLDTLCTFDLLVHTPTDVDTPGQWEESDARVIERSSEVQLRSFSTRIHKLNTTVSYRVNEMAEVL